MKKIIFLLSILFVFDGNLIAQATDFVSIPDFCWGNGCYYNINIGEKILFNNTVISLLEIKNHYNLIKVGNDTLWIKVARMSLPKKIKDIRIFVADNRAVKKISGDASLHGLLKKDALLCVSDADKPLLDNEQFIFPVSFNAGFVWYLGQEDYIFSFYKEKKKEQFRSFPGMGIYIKRENYDKKHWIVAVENSRVIDVIRDYQNKKLVKVILQGEFHKDIFYVYDNIEKEKLFVRRGQKLKRGDIIGFAAIINDDWRYLLFSILHSNDEIGEGYSSIVNGFPQVYRLYTKNDKHFMNTFIRGRITFGWPAEINGNRKNIHSFKPFLGKGWVLGDWNFADKVEWVERGKRGNARLNNILFQNTEAECCNPNGFYEYKIVVKKGDYRIRALVGDVIESSYQVVLFENILGGIFDLEAGVTQWTPERVITVNDGYINVKICIDKNTDRVAGLCEIVFQKVN